MIQIILDLKIRRPSQCSNFLTTKIQTALTDRVNEIEEQILMPDPNYQELNTKLNEILDRIGQNLPPDKERLLFDLDEVWVERDVLTNQRLYRQGLRDGMAVGRVLRMVRRVCRK